MAADVRRRVRTEEWRDALVVTCKPLLKDSKAGLLLALILATGMLFYVRRVLVPYQRADAAAHDHPRGNLSDLYPRWLGARELLRHGRDPYSLEITREIQIGYYGRALNASRAGDPRDQQAFAYPVYVVFLLAPIVGMPFQVIRPSFYGLLAVLIAASVLVWLRVLRWKPSSVNVASLILLVLGSMPVLQAIELQQLTLLVAALLALCALLLVTRKFAMAGIVLALATIKPQLVLPLAAWLIFWAASDWRRRRNFVWGFAAAMMILIGAGEWILPGWIAEFLHAVSAYQQYTRNASLFDNLTSAGWGPVLSVAITLIAAAICRRLRRDSEQSPRFVFSLTLVLAVTLVIVPTISTYNQVLLLPAVLLLVRQAPQLWKQSRVSATVWILAAAAVAWPWIAALALTVASFILPAARVQQAWALPFYTNLMTPLAILGLLFQYGFRVLSSGQPVQYSSAAG